MSAGPTCQMAAQMNRESSWLKVNLVCGERGSKRRYGNIFFPGTQQKTLIVEEVGYSQADSTEVESGTSGLIVS